MRVAERNRKKGVFNIEYFVVMTIFLMFSLYFAIRLVQMYPRYLRSIKEEILRSDSYRLSEILINNDGEPGNWTLYGFDDWKRFGLSNETSIMPNYLSLTKIVLFNDSCKDGVVVSDGYGFVKEKVGANHDFTITINASAVSGVEPVFMRCDGSMPTTGTVAVIRRIIAVDNGQLGVVTVEMRW